MHPTGGASNKKALPKGSAFLLLMLRASKAWDALRAGFENLASYFVTERKQNSDEVY